MVTGARQTGKTTLIGIEVKSRPEAHSSDLRSFPPVAKALEDRWLGGLVVHRGRRLHCLDEGRRVWAVPIHRLLV
ncbi:MAG: hypothetical protein FJ098_07220 [Deltaproteobacteria bacterium]|nr:hypothetical protein [Deltaproteobacteria bacterium]